MCVYYDEFSKKCLCTFFIYFEEKVPFYFVGVLETRYALAMEEKSITVCTLTAIGDLFIKLDFCSIHTNKVFNHFRTLALEKKKKKSFSNGLLNYFFFSFTLSIMFSFYLLFCDNRIKINYFLNSSIKKCMWSLIFEHDVLLF